MEKALQNTIIASNIQYRLSLKSFFKDQFRHGSDGYLIPFSHIIYTKRQIFGYIRESCGTTCSKLQKCDGHQFLEFIELLYQFNRHFIITKKVFFKYFHFNKFRLTFCRRMTLKPIKIKGWQTVPVDKLLIHHLTYSQRLSFLK